MNGDFIFTKRGTCARCGGGVFTLKKNLTVSGAEQFCWTCDVCGMLNPDKSKELWIPRQKVESRLTSEQMDNLPVIMPPIYTRCAVCGARATERHHWAPTAIFGKDSDKWPTDQLCKKHHAEWHHRVTPQLVSNGYTP